MRLFSYVMKYDDGFAPNTMGELLTLATCKPAIRRVAKVDDFIIGTGSLPRGDQGQLIYIMQVTEVLTIEEYSKDRRFFDKTPNMSGNKLKQAGDNIYRFEGKNIIQLDSKHSDREGHTVEKHITKDLSGKNVLISSNYVYYGQNSKVIPQEFRNCNGEDICIEKSGHKTFPKKHYTVLNEFIEWAYSHVPAENMVVGLPSDWNKK